MPTKWLSIGTTVVKLIEADATRESVTFKFPMGVGSYTAAYVRLADDRGGCDQDESYALQCGEAIHLCKADGDRVDKSWWARCASGTATITIIENFKKHEG